MGKLHLGPAESYPQSHGFDINIGGTSEFFLSLFGNLVFLGLAIRTRSRTGGAGDYLTDKLTEKAMEILDQKAYHQPVFLNLCYHSVHTPIDDRPEKVEK